MRPVHLLAEPTESKAWSFSGLPDVRDPSRSSVLLLADPHTFPAVEYLRQVSLDLPGVPTAGGLASGGQGPGQNLIFFNDHVLASGALAVVLEGDIEMCSSVSQGCRPVGKPFVITSCRDHLILKLRREGAAKIMLALLEDLSPEDRDLFKRGPFIGLAIDSTKSAFESGDLLVRNIVGIHPKEDAIAVAESSLRTGQTVQFMLRDSASATLELKEILASRGGEWIEGDAPRNEHGGLLFTCGGRGIHMFRKMNHDAACLQAALGPDLPLAGFFANGEIGPVGGENFLHGFSASMVVLRKRR